MGLFPALYSVIILCMYECCVSLLFVVYSECFDGTLKRVALLFSLYNDNKCFYSILLNSKSEY